MNFEMTGHRRPLTTALGTALALSLLASACGSDDDAGSGSSTTEAPPPATSGGSVTVGIEGEVDSFLPGSARWSASALFVARAVYDPLAAFDVDGVARPYLAESITPSDDFMSWTITLRPDITFHDGTPLDAEALRVNLDMVALQSGLTKSAFRPVQSVEVTGPLEVTMKMSTPWAHLDTVLANQTGFIVAPSTIASGIADAPLGTGPFVFESWEPDVEFSATRYEDYWQKDAEGNQLPYLDEVAFTPIVDPDSRLSALEAGDIGLMQTQSASQVIDFASGDIPGGVTVLIDESEGTEANIMFNNETGPFADPNLRKAAAHAFDRQEMIDALFEGYYDVANGPFAEASDWGTIENFPEFDPELAKEEVAAWSAANGGATPSVTLTVLPTTENQLIGNYVAEQWEAVGIETQLESVEEAAASAALVAGNFEVVLWSFWDRPDPDALYHYLYGDSTLNFPKYRSATVDEGLDGGRPISDKEARKAEYQKVWDDYGEQVPILWLYHVKWALAWRDGLYGVGDFTLPSGEKAQPITYGNTFLTGVWDATS